MNDCRRERRGCLATATVAALVLVPAAAAGVGTTYTFQVEGLSAQVGGGVPDRAPARLDVEATVTLASGEDRQGVADVVLTVTRPGEERTFSFEAAAWSGSVQEPPPGDGLRQVQAVVDGAVEGDRSLDLSVDAAGGGDALGAAASWTVRERACSGDDGGFHDHETKSHCVVTTLERGDGAGTGSAT